ncbi:S26 family signal peptidase [Phenylobacterium montanum]|uniref:S26 family signal peptidase n=2 Tax=Phenylobacterium montanum TaxID=2823693 RepID=A0A975IXA1_9CAUL|nr:S26 family signal peptidase [Caulobacter sp. S6]
MRLAMTTAGAGLMSVGLWFHPKPLLLWNASASVPIGLYQVDPMARPTVGDFVVFDPPAGLATFLANRRYLPVGVPLVKTIAAGPGQTVCRIGALVSVDAKAAAWALARDRMGRTLPVWQGCIALSQGQVFLLNRSVRDSLDGRYFGPVSARNIIGRARPIWIRRGA